MYNRKEGYFNLHDGYVYGFVPVKDVFNWNLNETKDEERRKSG